MTITADQAVKLVEITQRKADELFDEVIAKLRNIEATSKVGSFGEVTETEQTAPVAGGGTSDTWSLGNETFSGAWDEIGRQNGVTYTWPDGNVDEYTEFVSYLGRGGYSGQKLALGFLRSGDVIGFVLGSGGSKRGITYFFPTDDFEQTGEKVSMIRGGGPRGRSGFAPSEALPAGYTGFKTDVLRDRKAGKWNVQGVVADEHDHATMLGHTALQARLRRLA